MPNSTIHTVKAMSYYANEVIYKLCPLVSFYSTINSYILVSSLQKKSWSIREEEGRMELFYNPKYIYCFCSESYQKSLAT
jgi:hypothetical protein